MSYLDAGHTYYTNGFQVVAATNRPLYSFMPGNATTPVPDLAEGQPRISPDEEDRHGQDQRGIRYAPPVDRAATSADVKYAIERFLSSNVGGQHPGYVEVDRGTALAAGRRAGAPGGIDGAGRI